VIDTRGVGAAIRRRRQCEDCDQRFTTYERVAKVNLLVVKRDGRREDFDRQKLHMGILKACAKRPISAKAIEEIVSRIEMRLYALGQAEVAYGQIGEMVMEELRHLDEVAYVRFASVYRHFTDLEDMKQEVDDLLASRTS
jgi:transcriptional repressor NrdR